MTTNNDNSNAIINIMQSETFQITSRSLAQQLHIKLPDAQQALLEEIYLHRHNLAEATEQLTGRQKASINYAKKDILRDKHKSETAYMKLFTGDTDNEGHSLIENKAGHPVPVSAYSEDEIQRVMTVAPLVYRDTTAKYIQELLAVGAEQFKINHQWTTSYFNKQVKQWIKTSTAGQARARLNKLLKSDTQLKQEHNQELAKSFIKMIEDDAPKSWINNWLQQAMDNPYFDEAFDACHYQGKVVKQWDTPETRQDCYKFMNTIYKLAGIE